MLTCKVVMSILLLLRNYTPAHEQIVGGEWDVAPVARLSFDLEDKVVGTIGAGVRSYGQMTCSRLMGTSEDWAEGSQASSALWVQRASVL